MLSHVQGIINLRISPQSSLLILNKNWQKELASLGGYSQLMGAFAELSHNIEHFFVRHWKKEKKNVSLLASKHFSLDFLKTNKFF
jgi:hypothetical protein